MQLVSQHSTIARSPAAVPAAIRCTSRPLPFARRGTNAARSAARPSVALRAAAVEALPDIEERLERYEWERMNIPDLTGKTVLVTGGNSGIGFAICVALAKKNANVILTARDPEKGQWAADTINASLGTDKVEWMHLELSTFSTVKKFAEDFKKRNQPLNILINNAGIHIPGDQAPEKQGQHTPEGIEITLATNFFGPFLLTMLLLDKLKESAPSRIVFQGSPLEQAAGSIPWDDLTGRNKQQSDAQVYGLSKLYNICIAKALNEKLKGTSVEAFSGHPGITDTPLFDKTTKEGPVGAITTQVLNPLVGQPAERGASPLLHAAASPDVGGKGGAFIGGPVGGLAVFANLDQFGDRVPFTKEGKELESCLRLYDESLKIIQPALEGSH